MKAVVYYKNRSPEVFQWTDVDAPACGPNQVLIKNEYISIEGGDLIAREIMPPERVPQIVGYQCAGEIVEVGAEVQDRWVGQNVVTLVTVEPVLERNSRERSAGLRHRTPGRH